MLEWVVQYWLEIAFVAVDGIVLFLVSQVLATRAGLRALLRTGIIEIYNDHMHKEYIPIYDMESVTHMYEAYHKLGGNGTVTKLYKELQQLPSAPPETERTKDSEVGNSCLKMIQDKTSL